MRPPSSNAEAASAAWAGPLGNDDGTDNAQSADLLAKCGRCQTHGGAATCATSSVGRTQSKRIYVLKTFKLRRQRATAD
ncbi:MAG: hypothetical protein ACLPI9_01390, partial [Halobacteriota archaeon]